MSNKRRAPQQERGERRLAQLLEAASSVLAELGYDAATMTEIADRAGASIGTLYQYFPNKEAVVLALRDKYAVEMADCLSQLDEDATVGMSARQIAYRLVEIVSGFVEGRPAYFAILDAAVKYKRSKEARNKLRERIAKVFRGKKPEISEEVAYRVVNVSLQIIKGMNVLYKEANSKEREELVKEYREVLGGYLESRLGR